MAKRLRVQRPATSWPPWPNSKNAILATAAPDILAQAFVEITSGWATAWGTRLNAAMGDIWDVEHASAIRVGPRKLSKQARSAATRAEKAAARYVASDATAVAKRARTIAVRKAKEAEAIVKKMAKVVPKARAIPKRIDGLTVEQWTAASGSRARKMAEQTMRRSAVGNRSIEATARATRMVAGRHMRRAVTAISRMAATHATAHAHADVWKKSGARVVTWVSLLDGRTSPICRALSGRQWKPGAEDMRVPPAHPGCRSMLMPIYGGGAPPVDYEKWLRQQPLERQNDILGPSRGRLCP